MPRGQTLPGETWERRHRAMLWILWANAAGLVVFSLARGLGLWGSIGPIIPIALAGVAGTLHAPGRRARSVAVSLGLLTCSAVLVHAWNGQIEAHFHFFVMIAILALYEDWLPFGLAVVYVVIEHGVVGVISPSSVYNHGGSAWGWAAVHGAFVLGAAGAAVTTWRLNEDTRAEMMEADRRERQTAERFQRAFDSGVTGMAIQAPEGRYLRVNRALCEMTGYSEDELLARGFQSITHPDDQAVDLDKRHALMRGKIEAFEGEKRYVHRDGHEVWAQIGVSAVRAEDGTISYFIVQLHDITERKRFEEELSYRALHDPLTGLANRALFLDRVRHALARLRRRPGKLGVLFIDVDRFKLVNDGLGHELGDAVLREAAKRLSASARAGDTIARFGGDEFTILCEDAGEEECHRVAERVLERFAEPFVCNGHELQLTVSAGICVGDETSDSPDSLLRDADIALYGAKQDGRARFQVFDPQKRSVDRLATEQALRIALRERQLRLHYQPEVELESGRVVAVEALIRWQHPERGLIGPGEFIPVAEESGLIVPIGEWVLHEACAQLVEWHHAGSIASDVSIAVNVSARQLSARGLVDTVEGALERTGLEPRLLCLEITESAMVEDTDVSVANLRALKELGVRVAIDDFGVGFSSLSKIRELPPVDVIKIDRSFTAGLDENDSGAAVIQAVLSLTRSLGLTAIAEGVETADQLAALVKLGCEVGQGFLYFRPQPPAELERLLGAPALEPTTPNDGALA